MPLNISKFGVLKAIRSLPSVSNSRGSFYSIIGFFHPNGRNFHTEFYISNYIVISLILKILGLIIFDRNECQFLNVPFQKDEKKEKFTLISW